jgi:type IV pilus assembly protein PilC
MPATMFTFEAVDASGVVQKGKLAGESADKVAQSLANQKLTPITVSAAGVGLKSDIKLPSLRNRTTLNDLVLFTRQFASMMASGLTLLRTLSILEDQTVRPRFKEAIHAIRGEVQGGATLSTAMSHHPDHFSSLMVDMIRAGETGGFLDGALSRLATMYEADAKLKSTIKAALTYPVIVLCLSLVMGAAVIIFIVPIFERMFASLGGRLPLPTLIMVSLSHNMLWLGPLLIVAGVVGRYFFRRQVRRSFTFRLAVDKLKLRAPVFGTLYTKIAISRWARNLGTLVAVGVPLLQALEIVGGTSGSAVITEAMADVGASVREGNQVSVPLAKHALFPTMVVQMLEVGEETGQVTEMLDKTADYYDNEVQAATESLTSALEPLMVVIMGVVIGAMVICLYLPMFTIYQHIGS